MLMAEEVNKNMKKSKGIKAIEQVAKSKGISVEDVRREIEVAIDIAMHNPDSEAQTFWSNYIQTGLKPTPEEFIVSMANNFMSEKSCKMYGKRNERS
ncbi:MAG: hypothetical protein PHV32_09880 [Eubacteriales bacterium]|jgi:hypothetical protein|nr:hypothetical protein [Eubacteriales bacterium]